MKILQLVTRRQYRGAEVFAANLSQTLIERGIQIVFLGLYTPSPTPLHVVDADNKDLFGNPDQFIDFKIFWRLIKIIRVEKPDIIQANGSDTLKYAVLAGFFIKSTPLIYRNISIISIWIGTSVFKRMLYRLLFSRVHHVSSVGKFAVDDFVACIAYDRSRTSVIRRGIPLATVDKKMAKAQLIKKYPVLNEKKIAIHVGNFSEEKNHSFILNVFSELKETNNHVKLILVGDGKLFSTIEEEIVNRKLQETVILTGFRNDTAMLLAAADVLVLFSKVEGVPGVVLEAAAQQVPSVVISIGGVKEVVLDKKTGILVNGFDEAGFLKELLALLDNNSFREELGANAYDMVKKEFNPEFTADQFKQLYEKLLT